MNERQHMWLRPPENDDSVEGIWKYAITVNGYDYAKEYLKVDCAELANARLEEFRRNCCWQGTYEELRCCLFFEQRREHMAGVGAVCGRNLAAIKTLFWTVVAKWYEETQSDGAP